MPFLHIDMTQVVESLSQHAQDNTKTDLFHIVDIIGADVLATQWARASTPIIFTMLNRINSVPAR